MESNKFILHFSPDYITIFGEHATLFQKNWSQSSLSTHQSVWIGVRNPHPVTVAITSHWIFRWWGIPIKNSKNLYQERAKQTLLGHRKVVWGDFSAEKRSTSRMLSNIWENIFCSKHVKPQIPIHLVGRSCRSKVYEWFQPTKDWLNQWLTFLFGREN